MSGFWAPNIYIGAIPNTTLGTSTSRRSSQPEVGKVTLKSIGNEALNYEFLLKRNGDKALIDVFS
jgi:hypothetical protein